MNLAIIIPYYKLTFFKETLDSLANQTNKDFNVYIGNDASPENPEDLIKQYTSKFNITYKKYKENLGGTSLVKQWERCIDLAKNEEWLMILGDDDYLSEDVVKSFYNHNNNFEGITNVVRYSSQMIYTDNLKSKIYTHPIIEIPIYSHLRKYNGMSRSSLSEHIFRKKLYKKYGFANYPLAWYSDDKAWLDFSESRKIYTINESIVYIRVSKESISGIKTNLELKKTSAIQFYKDVVEEKLKNYKKKNKLKLLLIYEIIIKRKRKLTFDEWLFLLKKYFYYFEFIPILKLIRRFLISYKLF